MIMRIVLDNDSVTVWRYGRFELNTYTLTESSKNRLNRVLECSPFYSRSFADCTEWNRVESWVSDSMMFSNIPNY